jgi:hypothetical protein
MSMATETSEKFFTKYYGQLIGAKVVGFRLERDDSLGYREVWPVFTLLFGSQRIEVTLSSDEEGNGAGFAFIEELK